MRRAAPWPRVQGFCNAYGLERPVLMAPMAGASPVGLAVAVAGVGGMGACGALLLPPAQIVKWATAFRAASDAAFQINLWVPDPAPARDAARERAVADFLAQWGPRPSLPGDGPLVQDFDAQFQAVLHSGAPVISTIMGLLTPAQARAAKAAGVRWFATVTTVAEARAAAQAGADALIAQGAEAGGHRGAFDAAHAQRDAVGSLALIPAVADAVDLPVIAAGGIADGRGVAAALTLGASAVMLGSALLRAPEAGIAPAWADGLAGLAPEGTALTRGFSGRPGRAIATAYVRAVEDRPEAAPYPVQRALTAPMREAATRDGRLDAMQAWAGQAAGMARAEPAGQIVARIWDQAAALLPGAR